METLTSHSAPNDGSVPFHVLIAAAGSGQRLGGDTPKQYLRIAGKAILRHTIEAFLACPGMQSIRVIIDPDHAELYHDAVSGLDIAPPITGGEERNISIFNGLKELSNILDKGIVLIHDAARPLIRQSFILETVAAAAENGASSLSLPVSDTLRRDNERVDRSGLHALQTPQAFEYGLIMRAHMDADPKDKHTDDTSLVSAIGHDIIWVPGQRSNIKITTQDDLDMATTLMTNAFETRSASGFDVHAFDADKPGPARICGVDIDHDHALKGHSDADVGLHALTDALLGTIGAGDIGQLFPPSDPAFKGMDSAVFLQKAVELVAEKGGIIAFLDLTLICEEPKIGPHRDAMIARVADITGLSSSKISIKATTSEGLGFTGRKEGIAAQALATVNLPHDD